MVVLQHNASSDIRNNEFRAPDHGPACTGRANEKYPASLSMFSMTQGRDRISIYRETSGDG
jgi:hypothetical protein